MAVTAIRSMLVLALVLALAGCGGGKKTKTYTYNFAASGSSPLTQGIYLTLISPIPIPASAFKGDKPVDHVAGPEACSITQTIRKAPAKYPQFQGRTLTLKVYGPAGIAKLICALARKGLAQTFSP